MSEVECITLDGHTRKFQNDRLILRPAAYALIVHEGKLLLLKMRHTGKYHLPGGGINIGERMEETLKYFICRPKTLRFLADDQVEDESAEQPRWVEIRGLRPEDFQFHGDVVLELCKQAAA